MYRTRNAIVHSGEVPRNLKYLGEHLHSYLDSTANEFIVKLAGDIPFSSREDVITDVKFAIANLDSILEKDALIKRKDYRCFNPPRNRIYHELRGSFKNIVVSKFTVYCHSL
mgnify:CR=1 FL=1